MIIVGLTGGIASGKTFVAKYLKKMKIPVHESDAVVKDIYQSSDKKFVNFLFKNGLENFLIKEKINRKAVREFFFKDRDFKSKVESYLHKEVKKKTNIFLNINKKEMIVFLDIPLLFEKKLEKICNFVCCSMAPLKIREKRALQRKNMNKKIFRKIIKSQVSDTQRRARSNYLIKTHKTKTDTYLQVKNIIYDILKSKKKGKK